jgi:hypothetical protein
MTINRNTNQGLDSSGIGRIRSTVIILGLTLLLASGCASKRVSPPPKDEVFTHPWGAVNLSAMDAQRDDIYSKETIEAVSEDVKIFRESNPGKKIPYRILALSGGGSRGAYGAGVLTGWSEMGTRPEFDAVTGISTGALMATPAFLGPEYDHALEIFTRISNEDVFVSNGPLAMLTRESAYDTSPLRQLLKTQIDEQMVKDVAREYSRGRALYIGTTNLDAKVFTIWDMGKIAASDHPEKLQLFRDVILASASFPIAFPPVYLPITSETGEVYYQMHVDGGIRETVFLYDFLGEIQELTSQLGVDWEKDVSTEIYLLNNGKLHQNESFGAVKPSAISIAIRSMLSLLRANAVASIYNVWSAGLALGATVNVAYIPSDFDLVNNTLDFDTENMNLLFQLGYNKSLTGDAWFKQEPPKNMEELFESQAEFYEWINPVAVDNSN